MRSISRFEKWSTSKKIICVNCGVEFTPNSPKQVTCSHRCNVAKWRKSNPDKYRVNQKKSEEKRRGVNRYNSEQRKKWYSKKKHDENWMNNIKNKERNRYYKIQFYLNEYKSQKGCAKCGYKEHPAALHFHHIDKTKEINVCNATSISRAKKEIEKCIVLCANCHAIETYEEIQRLKETGSYPCKADIFELTYEKVEEKDND